MFIDDTVIVILMAIFPVAMVLFWVFRDSERTRKKKEAQERFLAAKKKADDVWIKYAQGGLGWHGFYAAFAKADEVWRKYEQDLARM